MYGQRPLEILLFMRPSNQLRLLGVIESSARHLASYPPPSLCQFSCCPFHPSSQPLFHPSYPLLIHLLLPLNSSLTPSHPHHVSSHFASSNIALQRCHVEFRNATTPFKTVNDLAGHSWTQYVLPSKHHPGEAVVKNLVVQVGQPLVASTFGPTLLRW